MESSKRIFVALATILVLEASAHDSYQNFQHGSPANNFNNQNKNVPLNTFHKFGQGNNQQYRYNQNQAPPRSIQSGYHFNQGASNSNLKNDLYRGPTNNAFNHNQAYQQKNNFDQNFNNGDIRQHFRAGPPAQNPQGIPQTQNFPGYRPVNNHNSFSSASSSASTTSSSSVLSSATENTAAFQNRPRNLNDAKRFNTINLPIQTGLPTVQTIKLPIPSNSKYKIVHLGPTKIPEVNEAGSKTLTENNNSYQQNLQPIVNENIYETKSASSNENVKEKEQFIHNLDPSKIEKAMEDIKEAELELSNILEHERAVHNREQFQAQTVSNTAGGQYGVSSTPLYKDGNNYPTSGFIGHNKPYVPIKSYSNSQSSASSSASSSSQSGYNVQNNLFNPYTNQFGNPSAPHYNVGTENLHNFASASNIYPGLNSPAKFGPPSFSNGNAQSQSFASTPSSASSKSSSFPNKNIGSQYHPNKYNLPPLNGINQPYYSPLNGPNYGNFYNNLPASSQPPITDFSFNKYAAPKLSSSSENGPTYTSYNSPNNNIFKKPTQPFRTDANQQPNGQDKTNGFGDLIYPDSTKIGNTVTATSSAHATSQSDATNSQHTSYNYQNTFDQDKTNGFSDLINSDNTKTGNTGTATSSASETSQNDATNSQYTSYNYQNTLGQDKTNGFGDLIYPDSTKIGNTVTATSSASATSQSDATNSQHTSYNYQNTFDQDKTNGFGDLINPDNTKTGNTGTATSSASATSQNDATNSQYTSYNYQNTLGQDKTNGFGDLIYPDSTKTGNTVTATSSATSQSDTTDSLHTSNNYQNSFDFTKYLPTNYQNYFKPNDNVPQTADFNNKYNSSDNPTDLYNDNNYGLNNPTKKISSPNINYLNNKPPFEYSNKGTSEQPYDFLKNGPSKVTSTSSASSTSSSSSSEVSSGSSSYAFNSNPYTSDFTYLPNQQPNWQNYGQIPDLVQPTYTPLDNKYLLPNNEFLGPNEKGYDKNNEFNSPINNNVSPDNKSDSLTVSYSDTEYSTSSVTSHAESSTSQDEFSVNHRNILTDNSPSLIGDRTQTQSNFGGSKYEYNKDENSATPNSDIAAFTTESSYDVTEPLKDVTSLAGSNDTETKYNGSSNVASSSSSSSSVATTDSETTDAKRTYYKPLSLHPHTDRKSYFSRKNPFRWQFKKNRFGHGYQSGTEDSVTFGQTSEWGQPIYDTTSTLPDFDDDASRNPSKDENKGTGNPLYNSAENSDSSSSVTTTSEDSSASATSQSKTTDINTQNNNDSQNEHRKDEQHLKDTDKESDGLTSESSYTDVTESSAYANSHYEYSSQFNDYTHSQRNKYLYGGRYRPRLHNYWQKHGPGFAFYPTDSPADTSGVSDNIFSTENYGYDFKQPSEDYEDSFHHTTPSYTNDEIQTSSPVTETNDSTDSSIYYEKSDNPANSDGTYVESESATVSETETDTIDIQNSSKTRKYRKRYPGYRYRQPNRWRNYPKGSYLPTTDTPVEGTTDNGNQYSFDQTTTIPYGTSDYGWNSFYNNHPLHGLYTTQSPIDNTNQYDSHGHPLLIPYDNTNYDWNNANTDAPSYNYPSQTQSPVDYSYGNDNNDQTTVIPNYDWSKANTDVPSYNYPTQSSTDDTYPTTYSPNSERDQSDINKSSYTSYSYQHTHQNDKSSSTKETSNTGSNVEYIATNETESDKKEETKKTETNNVQYTNTKNGEEENEESTLTDVKEKTEYTSENEESTSTDVKVKPEYSSENEESTSTDVKEKTEYSSETKSTTIKKSNTTSKKSEFSFDPQVENPYTRAVTIVLKILDSIEKLITGKCQNTKA